MLVLFDHGTPKGLIRALPGHTVHTAQAKGWDTLNNGALLKTAEGIGVDVLLTTDRRIRYQQNLSAHRIAIVVLTSTKWSRVRQQSTASLPLSPPPLLAATPRSRFPSAQDLVVRERRSLPSVSTDLAIARRSSPGSGVIPACGRPSRARKWLKRWRFYACDCDPNVRQVGTTAIATGCPQTLLTLLEE